MRRLVHGQLGNTYTTCGRIVTTLANLYYLPMRTQFLPFVLLFIACSSDPVTEQPSANGDTTTYGVDTAEVSGDPAADVDMGVDTAVTDLAGEDGQPDAIDEVVDQSVDRGIDVNDADSPELHICTHPERVAVDTAGTGDSWRFGGGFEYPDIVSPAGACTTVVTTFVELEAALSEASEGEIVYIDDSSAIDMTGASLCIPGGVWLASGRGRETSPGALLYTTETEHVPIFEACGDNVRVTGIRLYGADEAECPPEYETDECTGEDRTGGANCRDCMPTSLGIRAIGFDGLEIDNSELAGWSHAAVFVGDAVGVHVHHNHIHHNQRQGLGYGVVLMRGGDGEVTLLFENNRVNYNRHAIAGSGEPGQDYEARSNLVLEAANGHVFDMHGEDENTENGSELAGGEILIHENAILVPDQYAMVIRGRPEHGAWLFDNCLVRENADAAALQRFFTGNFHIDESPTGPAANSYGMEPDDCERLRWCTAAGGVGPWRYQVVSNNEVENLAFGDFNGDGKTDVFRSNGSEWLWSSAASVPWATLNESIHTLENLRFGDFNGDGTTDIFRATGSEWRWSESGTVDWDVLSTKSETIDEIAFGDFNGDGHTDVFTTTGSQWLWSSEGRADWATLNTSTQTLENLAFADFDGDGHTDVFHANGSQWQFSSGGSEPWEDLATSSIVASNLAFSDLDGDGRSDVIRVNGDAWLVSWGGTTHWERLRIDSHDLDELAFGDFDGDGLNEVFVAGCQ